MFHHEKWRKWSAAPSSKLNQRLKIALANWLQRSLKFLKFSIEISCGFRQIVWYKTGYEKDRRWQWLHWPWLPSVRNLVHHAGLTMDWAEISNCSDTQVYQEEIVPPKTALWLHNTWWQLIFRTLLKNMATIHHVAVWGWSLVTTSVISATID